MRRTCQRRHRIAAALYRFSDGRPTQAEVARRLGITQQAVSYRIRKDDEASGIRIPRTKIRPMQLSVCVNL